MFAINVLTFHYYVVFLALVDCFVPYCKYDSQAIASDDELLSRALADSDLVFSGKVIGEPIASRTNRTLVFRATVKRVFKGEPRAISAAVTVRKRLRDGEGTACRQAIRARYTAIFLGRRLSVVDRGGDGDDAATTTTTVTLIVDPVPITLGNLERINAATKDVVHKPKQTAIEEPSDPCRDKRCGFGARCVLSPDGRNASCRCPVEECPNHDSTTSERRPVCGTDAVDYKDECELRMAACNANRNITVKFPGQCDPCSAVQCAEPEVCQLDENRNAVCNCGDTCPLEFAPVCGSDGRTYQNECSMRREACRARKPLNIIYRGRCSSGVNPCTSVRCAWGEECTIDKHGIARCECPPPCEPIMRPICSRDEARTYASECELRRAACIERRAVPLEAVHAGVCECPVCPAEFAPVCGSDGATYGNACKLRLAACKTRRELRVVNGGPCDGCANKKCDFYAVCESDGATEGKCVCPESCKDEKLDDDDGPVCGTDGVTYATACQLRVASCKAKSYVVVAYKGDCDPCKHLDCQGAGDEPVCASNMRTYANECEMRRVACSSTSSTATTLSVIFYGDCGERFPATTSTEVKPCNGDQPLADAASGRELDCGRASRRQDCPAGSYCHQTARFARCCRHKEGGGNQIGSSASSCSCNKLGAYGDACDAVTRRCACRPGVGGERCDRCEPGYWGLPKISAGHRGCIPCGCSSFGSVREDCEQMTGRCVCKPGIRGEKCTICTSHDHVLRPNGCVPADASVKPPTNCEELTCHFGAECVESGGRATCECHVDCDAEKDAQIVCGSDGQTYASACQLRSVACSVQEDIVVQAFGTCKEDLFAGTDWPIRRYTPLQFTQPDDTNSPLSKSTRHLLVPDARYYYERTGGGGGGGGGDAKNRPSNLNADNNRFASTPNKLSSNAIVYDGRGEAAAAYRPTPATVRVVTALLGDLCSDDGDCLMIAHSSCVRGACTCVPPHAESADRQECVAAAVPPPPTTIDEERACASNPCPRDRKCIDLPASTFTCVCTANATSCERYRAERIRPERYAVPAFHGRSYVRLRAIKAYQKLSVDVEFKTYAPDAILFYDQQRADGRGDFVALAVVNGYVEFRYNLGSGAAVIRSLDRVALRRFHRVVVKRYHRDGVLKVGEEEEVAGQSGGALKALDLTEDAYVGYVPTNYSRVYENIGTDRGLRGCIRKLKVGRKTLELQQQQQEQLNGDEWVLGVEGVHECGADPCSSVPCLNGGRCRAIDAESFRCECSPQFAGDFCERVNDPCHSGPCKHGGICVSPLSGQFLCRCPPGRRGDTCESVDADADLSTPEFDGSSFIELPRLEGVGKTFAIEVFFRSQLGNGLLLYNGQRRRSGRGGDFIALALVHGHVQFRFNLGSGIANITSKERIALGEWHWVRIFRNGREGILQLDNSTVIRGYSGPPLTELNLELPFYVGSVAAWPEVHRLAGASKGFRGAIQRILLNGQPLPISGKLTDCGAIATSSPTTNRNGSATCAHRVRIYDGSPCPLDKNPCENNGLCIPDLNNYICQCHANYVGKRCENVRHSETAAIKFTGNTFLQYKNRGYRRRKGERGNRYELKLRTFESDGLLLWRSHAKKSIAGGDYFAVAIVDGYPELSYNLGKEHAFWAIRSKIRVDDGEWHTIRVRRRKRVGFVAVDGETPSKGASHGGAISLSTNSKLWIGGMPSLPPGLPSSYYKGFEGCLHHLHVNAKPFNLLKSNSDASLLQFCHENEI